MRVYLRFVCCRRPSQSLSDGYRGVVRPNPPAGHVFGAAERGVGECIVSPVCAGDSEGELFTHEFVGALLALVSKVVIGEMVAIEVLMSTAL